MIGIIDYKMNNLRSVQKAFESQGFEAVVSSDPAELRKAEKLILPGVGAFGKSMETIRAAGFDSIILDHVAAGKPLLGICLGMQLLFSESEELGHFKGLNILQGRIIRFSNKLKVPQIGWNQIDQKRESCLLQGIKDNAFVYFVHSYYVATSDDVVIATTSYGLDYASIVQKGNVFGLQFHPEKSQSIGLAILRNFATL